MDFSVSTWMVIFFVLFMVIGMWKIAVFLPNKQLADDDTTKESQNELQKLMLQIIIKNEGDLTLSQLYKKMEDDTTFDKKHFWRFNENKLQHLLNHYYILNPQAQSIKDIWHVEMKKN